MASNQVGSLGDMAKSIGALGQMPKSAPASKPQAPPVGQTGSNKSIGSLETWEPDDKSFSKHTFKEGTGDVKPNEGSVCTVLIIPVGKWCK